MPAKTSSRSANRRRRTAGRVAALLEPSDLAAGASVV
jgi:hypothetical protein